MGHAPPTDVPEGSRGGCRCGNPRMDSRDPKLTPFREPIKEARAPGFAGVPSRKASEALTKYIILDMFVKAIQGATPDEAIS